MSEFEIEISKIKNDAEREKVIAGRIKSLSGEIRSVAKKIHLDSNTENIVRKNLNELAEKNSNNAEKVKKLSCALNSIVQFYEKAEQKIVNGKSTDDKEIQDKLKEIRNKIRDTEGSLGMDTAAEYSDDPVNLANGNYVYEKSFFHFDTIIPINLRFFYNVKGKEKGTLGSKWKHNFEKSLCKEEDIVRILMEDGSEHIFLCYNGVFSACGGVFGELIQTEDGYLYTDDEGYINNFDINGKLRSMSNKDGWKINLHYENNILSWVDCSDNIKLMFEYNDAGRLMKVRDHTGRKVSVKYKEDYLSEVTDPQGNTTKYEYNEKGYLVTITTPLGNVGLKNEFDNQGRTIEQTFPDGGQVNYEYDNENNSIIMTRQNGERIVYVHDSLYRNTEVVYSDGVEKTTFNENNQKTSFTDRLGNQTKYEYDEKGRLKEIINALDNKLELFYTDSGQLREIHLDGVKMASCEFDDLGHQIAATNARGFQSRFEYDRLGRVTEIIHEDESKTCLSYDENGNIVLVEDPLTGKTKYVYDNCHRVIKTIDALGNVTEYSYDLGDNLTEVVNAKGDHRTYAYDAQGNVTRIEDFNHGVVSIEYNTMNNPVHVKDADGNSTYYDYDLMGNVTKVKTADGAITSYEYNGENRKTRIIYPSGGEEKAIYDAAGNMLKRISPDGGIYQFQYDALGRPVQITDPLGRVRKAKFDNQGNVTDIFYEDGSEEHFQFDRMGNRVFWQDKNGYIRYYSYDALNNLTQIKDDIGVIAEYKYLPGGKILSEKSINGSSIEYKYDAVGNLIRAESNTEGIWNFTYDSLGQVIQVERENVGIEKYEYDACGNVISVTDGEGNQSFFDYSLSGSLIRVTDGAGVQTGYRYDGCYRLTDILQPENGRLDIQKLNEYNRSQKEIRFTTYMRDENGNVISVVNPEGYKSEYEYDLCGRITACKDAEGYWTRCSYRKDGTEEKISFQDGRTIKYQYDALKRLSQIEDWLGVTCFQRDAEGRVIQTTDHLNQTTSYKWNERGECTEIVYPDGNNVIYEYDNRMRLVKTIHGGKTAQYSYYANGMMKEKIMQGGFKSRYLYNSEGNIAELCNSDDDKTLDYYQYFYDKCGRKGRIVESHDYSSGIIDSRFFYNKQGSLCSVEKNGQKSEQYTYDIFGNRTESVHNGVKTFYEYDRLNQLISSTENNQIKRYTYDHRGNLSGISLNGIQKLSLQFDALNRMSNAKSENGEATYEYNGLDVLTGSIKTIGGKITKENYSYDYTKPFHNLLTFKTENEEKRYVWDQGLLFEAGKSGVSIYLNDERMNPTGLFSETGISERYNYDLWGKQFVKSGKGEGNSAGFGFTGYQYDSITGFYYAGKRRYDSENGRFISQDPVAGSAYRPVTCNPFIYCIGDPINRYDPSGAITAWLAGGIIGIFSNLASKIAGDIITSVKTGKVSVSPWQEYVGAAAGGFVQGTLCVIPGLKGKNGAIAGAAGSTVETFVSNGLKMITGQEGYRTEDGYNVGKLFSDTAGSAFGGAISGFTFGKATKYIKIPGITSGSGNWDAAVRIKLTAASHGYVHNIGIKTLMKGIATQGILKTLDSIITKGVEAFKDWIKDSVLGKIGEILYSILNGIVSLIIPTCLAVLLNFNRTAQCPAAGV